MSSNSPLGGDLPPVSPRCPVTPVERMIKSDPRPQVVRHPTGWRRQKERSVTPHPAPTQDHNQRQRAPRARPAPGGLGPSTAVSSRARFLTTDRNLSLASAKSAP